MLSDGEKNLSDKRGQVSIFPVHGVEMLGGNGRMADDLRRLVLESCNRIVDGCKGPSADKKQQILQAFGAKTIGG